MKLSGKRILVLGAGKSGISAQKFLEQRGANVTLCDDIDKGVQQCKSFDEFDLHIISPGISKSHAMAKAPLLGELELGFTTPHKKIIAVTGTNGKTTVVNMLHRALNLNKNPFIRKSVLCGNVGIPVTSVSKQIRNKTAVVEASSFQLETVDCVFRPNIAVILNITQDHLERHGSMEEYIRCKSMIFKNKKRRDILILNYDDENCRKLANDRTLFFSTEAKVRGIYLEGKNIMLNLRRRAKKIFTIDQFAEEKPHSIKNILATVLVCKLMRVSKSAILAACKSVNAPHRLQYVGKINNAQGSTLFYNDSKSTNIASTIAACTCFKTPVNLIVGGVGKHQNFAELFDKLPNVVENVFVFGQSAKEIVSASKNSAVKVTKCSDMLDSLQKSVEMGGAPRIVLLSPACASFDMFKNYEERGEKFTNMVYDLIEKSFVET